MIVVQTYDNIFHSEAFLYRDLSEEEIRTTNALRKLKTIELVARYGSASAI